MPRSGGKKKWKSSSKPDHAHDPKHQPSIPKRVCEYNQRVQAEVQALFEKKFAFVRPTEGEVWALPSPTSLFSTPVVKDWDPVLNQVKEELNNLKSELSDKDIRQWHQHTSFTHRSALIMPHLRNNFWAELCTQAWCKFYEIASSYGIIQPGLADKEGAPFNSVHLCEAPGAFVTSLNHFIRSSGRLRHLTWNWLATTLNPYYEGNSTNAMIADDRFILQTRDHWFFGVDNTGDLMNRENLTSLRQRVEATMGAVHLVTADGSINCQNDPAEQETVVSQLHYCEVVTAMALLAAGGSLVLKMFTLFEHQTACLMFLLNCAFQQVHVCKPATSKAGNSEVYVVCLGFIGQHSLEAYLPGLLSHFGSTESSQALFAASDIPALFLQQLHSCAATFKEYQMTAISENIWLYPQMSEAERHRLNQVRQCCCQAYVERYAVSSIRKADKICPDSSKGRDTRTSVGMFAKTSSKRLHGTFTERQQLDHGPWLQRLNADYQQLAVAAMEPSVVRQTVQNNRELMPGEVETWDVTVGRRLTSIQSSSFCIAEVLDDWNLAWEHSPVGCKDKKEDIEKGTSCEQATSCDQAVVDLMLADMNKLHKISKSESAITCLCLLARSQADETFLRLLNSTNHWILRDCLVATSGSPDVRVTVVQRGQNGEHSPWDGQSSMAASPMNASHLSEPAVLIKCRETLQNFRVPVVYADCFHGAKVTLHNGKPDLAELDARLQSLASVMLAMHALHIGGMLIIRVPGILTRFSSGLLYTIYKAFQKVTLLADSDGGESSGIIIMAQGFMGTHPVLNKHLWKVYSAILEAQGKEEADVLQFVPQSQLCEKDFNSAVTAFNEKILTAQTCLLVKKELAAQQDREQVGSHSTDQTR